MLIGVVGTGRMGLPISQHLAAVHEVVTSDPAVAGVRDLGHVDVLVTVLPGPAAVVEVEPLLASLRPQATWLDLTSNDPRVAIRLSQSIAAQSVAAPMSGGPQAARSAELHFTVGGDDVPPGTLDLLGTQTRVGTVFDAHLTKLLSNLLWFGQAVAAAEALALGRALGSSAPVLGRALAAGAGGGRFLDDALEALLADQDILDFAVDRVVEQLSILQELAVESGSPFEVSAAVVQRYRDALDSGGGELAAALRILASPRPSSPAE